MKLTQLRWKSPELVKAGKRVNHKGNKKHERINQSKSATVYY
jgi:hypothetical protein